MTTEGHGAAVQVSIEVPASWPTERGVARGLPPWPEQVRELFVWVRRDWSRNTADLVSEAADALAGVWDEGAGWNALLISIGGPVGRLPNRLHELRYNRTDLWANVSARGRNPLLNGERRAWVVGAGEARRRMGFAEIAGVDFPRSYRMNGVAVPVGVDPPWRGLEDVLTGAPAGWLDDVEVAQFLCGRWRDDILVLTQAESFDHSMIGVAIYGPREAIVGLAARLLPDAE